MHTIFFAALLGYCTLAVAAASDEKIFIAGFQDFQGRYDMVDGRLLTIKQRGQRHTMQLDDRPETEIVAVGPTVFEARSGQMRIEFIQYPNGNVPSVRLIDISNEGQSNCRPSTKDLRRSCIGQDNVPTAK